MTSRSTTSPARLRPSSRSSRSGSAPRRLGRAWIAIREDEDVAEAIGINLIQTKLLAYMLGAAFAGLGGADLRRARSAAVFPASINLFVSINVVALIIVGGMGSIPGVVVGALFLIGSPSCSASSPTIACCSTASP